MKRVIAALFVGVFGLSACASTVNTKADDSQAKGGSGSSAKIGQPVTIKGNDDGSKLQVIAKKVVKTRSTDGFTKADPGKRIVAVQFSMVNTGKVAYNDAPCNGAKVVDGKGQQFDCDIMFQKIGAGSILPANTKLAPGNKALGFLTFQIPMKSKVKQVQFSMDSGFADTAQWNVR